MRYNIVGIEAHSKLVAGWIPKLKDDQRNCKADISIIVSQTLPSDINNIGQCDGVWITNFRSVYGIALALRENLLQLNQIKTSNVGRGQKMDAIYNYLCSNEFKQRIEAIVEAFTSMNEDLLKEKTAMQRMWSKREKQISNVVTHTTGMYGELQALIGAALPPVEMLELPGGEE